MRQPCSAWLWSRREMVWRASKNTPSPPAQLNACCTPRPTPQYHTTTNNDDDTMMG